MVKNVTSFNLDMDIFDAIKVFLKDKISGAPVVVLYLPLGQLVHILEPDLYFPEGQGEQLLLPLAAFEPLGQLIQSVIFLLPVPAKNVSSGHKIHCDAPSILLYVIDTGI